MNAKKALIEEFTTVHEGYLRALAEYVPPAERKLLMEESITRATDILSKADDYSEEDLKNFIGSVKQAQANIVSPKGVCSKDCMMNLLRTQDLVMATSFGIKEKGEARQAIVIGILELTNSLVADTLFAMAQLGTTSTKATWETNQEIHRMALEATQMVNSIADAVRQGNIMAIKLPEVDKSKYKEFVN